MLLYADNLKPWFKSSKQDSETVSCILDPCHMLKLIRNTLADWGVLRNASGELIKWEYIEALHQVQVVQYYEISFLKGTLSRDF
jgi:hypothetical protein